MSRNQKSSRRQDPRAWRLSVGISQAKIARKAGITGKNPARTFDRYERGETECPAEVVEVVRRLSAGVIGAEAWQKVRLARLKAQRAAQQQIGAGA